MDDCSYEVPLVVVGHHTGDISVVVDQKVENKIGFNGGPVTCIKVKDGHLYTSTTEGVFKRQPAALLGMEVKSNKKMSQFYTKGNTFSCNSLIICFEIITNCGYNKSVPVEGHQHEAVLACYDGFLYVISREMNEEMKIRVSHDKMLTGTFLFKEES